MENLDHILVFKTNISCEDEKQLLHTIFDEHDHVESWSIDMEDSDCVLRVITYTLSHDEIINLINQHGYECCELI